ncbi:MAG: T9SS type A sorting domain-containing protein, partial [Bacteroidota bacterium]
LFVYTPDGERVLGAFTSKNNKASGRFATGLIPGDVCMIEYVEPREYPGRVRLSIEAVGHAYRDVPFAKRRKDFGSSNTCHVNVNCEEGSDKTDARDATARILVTQGQFTGWCTGVLVNNTAEDGTPYLLSAEHCAYDYDNNTLLPQSDIDQWVFYFNYESANCENPASEQEIPNHSIVGATRLATSDDEGGETGSDMLLLELSERPQDHFEVYYAGWDRTDYGLLNPPPSSGFSIHHPVGDIKKISTFSDQLISTSYGSNPLLDSHWQVTWSSTPNGHGVTEGGSSGSALFNNDQQVIGTLTGGSSTCDDSGAPDEYGKFSYHWSSNGSAANRQLAPWLDPNNSGTETLSGRRFVVSSRPAAPGRYTSNTIPLIVKVYPNPSTDRFTLEMLPKLATGASVEVYNTIGGRVNARINREGATEGKLSVDLAGNAAGLYFIKLRNGKYSTIEKVELTR